MGEKEKVREEARKGEEAAREGDMRLFVNADMYKCLAICNMAMVRTTL